MYSTGLGVCRIPDVGRSSAAVMLGTDSVPAPQDVECRLPARRSIAVDPLHYIISSHEHYTHVFHPPRLPRFLSSPPDTGLSPSHIAWVSLRIKASNPRSGRHS